MNVEEKGGNEDLKRNVDMKLQDVWFSLVFLA